MEPLKGGILAKVPIDIEAENLLRAAQSNLSTSSWAICFAASLDGVLAIISGMSNLELSTTQNTETLTNEEKQLLAKVIQIYRESGSVHVSNI